jgi:pyruvate dehydrogenase E2 component (dihydrolipoamide acetyltransferase)
MAIVEVRLPEISENVASGDVTKVLVKVGDTVAMDQPLIELETEKAVFEVPSTAAGTITDIHLKPGDSVDVGGVIAKIETEAKQGAAEKPAAPAPAPKEEQEQPKQAPAPQPQPRAEERRPAQNPTQPTPARPVSQDASPAPSQPESTADNIRDTVVAVAQEQGAAVPASPTVRRMARELGVDINKVSGSGPGGRISSEDVSAYAKSIITGASSSQGAAAVQTGPLSIGPARALPDFSRYGDVERTPMSKVRAITAQSMAYAWNSVPHVTQHDEADITALEEARKKYALRVEQRGGGKLTMTAILTKVCASALRRFPDFNASIDVQRGEIVHKKYFNIGIAVDTDRGLLVPVVKGVDAKNLVEIASDVTALAEKARTKKIMPDDLEGGCFTISNLGGIGGVGFTPIVYAPEVAILGVSRASMKPVYINHAFEPRLMLPLSLSYDHRLIDGAAAARFLRWVCEALEDPILLAIEG